MVLIYQIRQIKVNCSIDLTFNGASNGVAPNVNGCCFEAFPNKQDLGKVVIF
jgi:hypothetical protein